MADKRNQIRFIHSSHHERPGAASAQTQQQVRSQAARAAHAKARRQRTANYQAIEARNRSDGHPEQSCSSSSTTEVETSVLSSPVMLLGYGRRDPFASFARPLSPIEDFLLDYYSQSVAPCSTLQDNDIIHPHSYARYLNTQFVQLAITGVNSLNGLFLVACRQLSQRLPHEESHLIQLALQYKIACARSIIEVLSSLETRPSISDTAVVVALFLAQDEILIGDAASTRRHQEAAAQMLRHNGPLKKPDFSPFLHHLFETDMVDPI